MYLIFLVKDGKEEAFSIIDAQPTIRGLLGRLQDIANHEGCPVVARSHYPLNGEIVDPARYELRLDPAIPLAIPLTKPENTKLEKILSGEDA